MLRPILFATLVTMIAATAPAAAQERAQTVSYRDLNLSSPEGVAMLRHRISSAATEVCGVDGSRDLGEQISAANCRSKAMRDANIRIASLVQVGHQLATATTPIEVAAR